MQKIHSQWIKVMLLISLIGLMISNEYTASATSKVSTQPDLYAERMHLFENMSTLLGIPWYYLAAIDQYERTLSMARPKQRPQRSPMIGITVSEQEWAGILNPNPQDTNPSTIAFFQGKGIDGDGDGKADRLNDTDMLYMMAKHILRYGTSEEDFQIAMWEYYHNSRSVERITQFAKVYEAFQTIKLTEHAFPLPARSDYSYRSTWGAARSWGGYRIHEGTDLFARYGVPVRSTAYGVVEVKGWNRFGGWRIGIRDINNVYHYFAHLSGFNKEVKLGEVIKPGQVIGWVGSSGYGKPGTQGKFPPHLHYGMYRDYGHGEWSFDPYPHLRQWERQMYAARKRRG